MESNFNELKGTNLNRILKGSKIAEIDSRCIAEGIESKWLMKNAGSRVAEVIKKDFANMASADTSPEIGKDAKKILLEDVLPVQLCAVVEITVAMVLLQH